MLGQYNLVFFLFWLRVFFLFWQLKLFAINFYVLKCWCYHLALHLEFFLLLLINFSEFYHLHFWRLLQISTICLAATYEVLEDYLVLGWCLELYTSLLLLLDDVSLNSYYGMKTPSMLIADGDSFHAECCYWLLMLDYSIFWGIQRQRLLLGQFYWSPAALYCYPFGLLFMFFFPVLVLHLVAR